MRAALRALAPTPIRDTSGAPWSRLPQ